jgi:hypothetical protein
MFFGGTDGPQGNGESRAGHKLAQGEGLAGTDKTHDFSENSPYAPAETGRSARGSACFLLSCVPESAGGY